MEGEGGVDSGAWRTDRYISTPNTQGVPEFAPFTEGGGGGSARRDSSHRTKWPSPSPAQKWNRNTIACVSSFKNYYFDIREKNKSFLPRQRIVSKAAKNVFLTVSLSNYFLSFVLSLLLMMIKKKRERMPRIVNLHTPPPPPIVNSNCESVPLRLFISFSRCFLQFCNNRGNDRLLN